jgi:hypothetical protein
MFCFATTGCGKANAVEYGGTKSNCKTRNQSDF